MKKKGVEVRRVSVKLGMSHKKIMKRYVKQEIPQGHSIKDLLKTGMSILREAEAQ
jgi:hypothetical protein